VEKTPNRGGAPRRSKVRIGLENEATGKTEFPRPGDKTKCLVHVAIPDADSVTPFLDPGMAGQEEHAPSQIKVAARLPGLPSPIPIDEPAEPALPVMPPACREDTIRFRVLTANPEPTAPAPAPTASDSCGGHANAR